MNLSRQKIFLTQQRAVLSEMLIGLAMVSMGWLMASTLPASAASPPPTCAEPNIEIAGQWWPELTNVYTPIGWKNHLFRFAVYYNGMILAPPEPEPEQQVKILAPWKGLGAQIAFLPSPDGKDPFAWRSGTYQMTGDHGRRTGYQGWLDRPTPVLWTQWRQAYTSINGIALRQEVFAHVPGGQDIETGTEPLFAWIRLSVEKINPLIQNETTGFLIKINKPHITYSMDEGKNLFLTEAESEYPRPLTFEQLGEDTRPGCLLVEEGGKIRLAILPGKALTARLLDRRPEDHTYRLHLTMPVMKGAFVDLLLPMCPESRAVVEKEMALGREAALAECDRYWSRIPETAAHLETPETYVNEYLWRNLQFGEIIAQKMPDTGLYVNMTGAHKYARVWATPNSMFNTMLLDTMGYHEAVDRYLESFRAEQGTAKPSGPSYDYHPGYLAAPRSLKAHEWLADHGAILHAASYHALLTDDQDFIDRWREPIIKACEFIRDARANTNHAGVLGVLPPAIATDADMPEQAVWNVAWHYRGLSSAVHLLKRLNHPRAAEFAQEAEDFRTVFLKALRERTQTMPTWTDARGRRYPFVPYEFPGHDVRGDHAVYLDCGPLILVYAGLLPAEDEMMQSTLAFFREGPNHNLYDLRGDFAQPPVLVHELSSFEPCYSFNVFHSHQLGDRQHFLEGMYSMLAGAHSRNTYICCESRGGITGIAGQLGIYMIRLAVVDDAMEPDTLQLLRLVPRAWLSEQTTTRFENVPTLFGPVTVNFRLTEGGTTLDLDFRERFRHPPAKILLHVPPLPDLNKVVINGKSNDAGPGDVLTVPKL